MSKASDMLAAECVFYFDDSSDLQAATVHHGMHGPRLRIYNRAHEYLIQNKDILKFAEWLIDTFGDTSEPDNNLKQDIGGAVERREESDAKRLQKWLGQYIEWAKTQRRK